MDQIVWIPDPEEGFVLAKIVDMNQDSVTAKTIKSPTRTIQASYNSTFPKEENDSKEVNDNCALMYLNEATLLNNLRLRYNKDKIYTYVANILIAINPYFDIKNLYTTEMIKQYQGKSLGVLSPHVFAIADKAYRDMRTSRSSQSVIVSGESGAGKTESTKYVLKYLCESWGTHSGQIEQLILDANPVLEAFGNAKTVRNRNSSRFGKFIEIHFSSKYAVVGGYISHYLLEKSRICGQGNEERNYHIFYQLIAGLNDHEYKEYGLSSPDKFAYLAKGCTQFLGSKSSDSKIPQDRKSVGHKKSGILEDPIVDDLIDFKNTDRSLDNFGVELETKKDIYKIVAALLHLGNVSFEESEGDSKGGSKVTNGSMESLQRAADLIGIDSQELKGCLLSRIMQTNKGGQKGTVYLVPLKAYEAGNARDALSKAIYSKLFDYLVTKIINKSIPFSSSSYYIGVLDIAGFEYFKTNSFEQFCINYCNEKLQQFFNERILKEEQDIYSKEGLGLKHIEYIDNQDCIDLLEGKSLGIFDLLDEESKLPKPSPLHFTDTVHSKHSGHFRLDVPRKSKLKDHRELRDDEGFLIKHFAGAVCYQTFLFIDKNNDALHGSLENLMSVAKNVLMRDLFNGNQESIPGISGGYNLSAKSSSNQSNKLAFISVGSRFRSQLNDLMTKLRSTGTHFIRCIKPNQGIVPRKFEGSHILAQLRCSGMNSVLELMQQGYPSRTSFADLYQMYQSFLPNELKRLDPRMFCRALFKALGLNESEFKFGSTKVFFRPGKFAEFDQIMKSDPENLAQLIKKVSKWLLISRWKKAQWCALSVIKLRNKINERKKLITQFQSNVRRYLIQKKFKERVNGMIALKKSSKHLKQITDLIVQIKDGKLKSQESESVNKLLFQMETMKNQIRCDQKMSGEEIKKQVESISNSINETISRLSGKIKEQKRLQQMEEEMRKEKVKKEEEERKKKEEEELKRRKQELERKFELENQQVAESSTTTSNGQITNGSAVGMNPFAVTEEEMKEYNMRNQQEVLDHDLALRLAQSSPTAKGREKVDFGCQVSPVMAPKILSPPGANGWPATGTGYKKYDLTKWKYSELRDTINTSCDIQLLEECREEFHRRLRVYHEWKAKNQSAGGGCNGQAASNDPFSAGSTRAPPCIMQNAMNGTGTLRRRQVTNGPLESRYFRIPFIRPSVVSGPKGWWFAHFEGQWIARQMELHPEKLPILLVAGKDDMQMCELSLEETRLTTKRGAEILPEEFEREWIKNGGSPWKSGKK